MKRTVLLGGDSVVSHVVLDPGEICAREIRAAQTETIEIDGGGIMVWVSDIESGERRVGSLAARHHGPVIQAGVEHSVRNDSATEPAQFLSIMRRAQGFEIQARDPERGDWREAR